LVSKIFIGLEKYLIHNEASFWVARCTLGLTEAAVARIAELGTRAFFALSRFRAREHEAKKKARKLKEKKARKKAKAPSAKEKKREFALFLSLPRIALEARFQGLTWPAWGGGGGLESRVREQISFSCCCPHLSCSACHVQPVLFCLSYSACLSCSAFPVLPVMFLPVLS
jgi:hypothetical protein